MSIQNIKTLRSAIDGIISERNSIAYIQHDIENRFTKETDAEIVKIFNDQINGHQDTIKKSFKMSYLFLSSLPFMI